MSRRAALHRAAFHIGDLEVVEEGPYEPVTVGDFVRLASGSPLGLVLDAVDGVGDVMWFNDASERSRTPLACLRSA